MTVKADGLGGVVYAVGTIFRLDITQVGSDTAGSDLTVTLFGGAVQ